ncbi:uncharacterized protein LOC116158975 [Photinus pyralis]|uniref:uncharacterized protein LOC116158975 n=1 Tax=Photinus pyralis TaxID=7054 RepID=UPI0012670829|nr:uncharacterized protein LOC116158975 [Photinus pyralis]
MDNELVELPVLVGEEVITLVVTSDEYTQAVNDETYLKELVSKSCLSLEPVQKTIEKVGAPNPTVSKSRSPLALVQEKIEEIGAPEPIVNKSSLTPAPVQEIIEEVGAPGPSTKGSNSSEKENIVWRDTNVLMFLDVYRNFESQFEAAGKKNSNVWGRITEIISKPGFAVTGLQCSVKMAGLKRTYKTIKDANSTSGNSRTTWQYFNIMDEIFGKKGYMSPPAIASSDGPSEPSEETLATGSSVVTLFHISDKIEFSETKKRKKNFSQLIYEDIQKQKKVKETKEEEKQRESLRRHNEKIQVAKDLVTTLKEYLNK